MYHDPIIRQCFTMDVEPPRRDMDIVEYCDWEARAMGARPEITRFGRELLEALEEVAAERH